MVAFGAVRWVFFDMGSTLVDETESYRAWFANAAAFTHGGLTAQQIEREYCAGMARYAPTISKQLAPFGYTQSSAAQFYPSGLDRPYPEALAVVADLARVYQLGIIANQNPGAEGRLEQYGLRSYFGVVVASAEAGIQKPDPAIFHLALRQAACPPDQAVMIGDRPDNDIYPAKQLGMKTIRIQQGYAACQVPRSQRYEADLTVGSLSEVRDCLLSDV